MGDFAALLSNALAQGLIYGLAVLGLSVSFRVLRYPDLTADGSFLLGASALALATKMGQHWFVALALGTLAGAIAGCLTAVLHFACGVTKLLSGILVSMMAYSAAFHILRGRSNMGLMSEITIFTSAENSDTHFAWTSFATGPMVLLVEAVVVTVAAGILLWVLRSEVGLLVRASGSNPELLLTLGHRPSTYQLIGLTIGNGLVGLAGALVAAQQGFADVNMSIGLVVNLIASLVIGEKIFELLRIDFRRHYRFRVLSALVGTTSYYLLYLAMIRASIRGWVPVDFQPTDLKFLSALIVVAIFLTQSRRKSKQEEATPL